MVSNVNGDAGAAEVTAALSRLSTEAPAPASARVTELPPALVEKPVGLPPGNYALVGWDMDTTGRRLIDEICQIVAYTPKSEFSQYIMPHGDLNPGARRRHNVRVVTIGRYRMLKDNRTHKVLKTKSEVSALTDFLDWLEKEKGDASSIILIYHEPRRLSPTMLLEALIRYDLLDRFNSLVSGFADGYALAAEKCRETVKSVTLRSLARVLLDAENVSVEAALDRATTAYRIVEHLSQAEREGAGAGAGDAANSVSVQQQHMVEAARSCARPVHTELAALHTLKHLLELQNTFRPVFGPLLHAPRLERQKAAGLRRLLAEAGLNYEQLKAAWEEDNINGLTNKLSGLKDTAKEDQIKEILEILDCHFDPAKEAKTGHRNNYKNKHNKSKQNTSNAGAANSESHSPDTESSEGGSPRKIQSQEGAVDSIQPEN